MSRRSAAVQIIAILLFLLIFATLAWRADQPIVENYVGRQVPTAMVARNLERGSGFLRPQLDTGPFPNLFLVEPPLYASAVVGLRRLLGNDLTVSGRLTSALCMTLGAWGLFGLVRRREGNEVALLAVGAFALLPLTLRYGRAFQPDAAMLGTQLAALRLWDEFLNGSSKVKLAMAWLLLALSLALKVTSAFLFIPLGLMIWQGLGESARWKRIVVSVLALSALLPVLVWYLRASWLIEEGQGSRASADNSRIWLSVFWPTALLDGQTYIHAARMLLVRAFTPLGALLALWGLTRPGTDRLWQLWAGAAGLALLGLAAKLHHEYYGMVLIPLVAVGIARSLSGLAQRGWAGRCGAVVLGACSIGLSIFQAADTWRTPADWRALPEAVAEIQRLVPPGEWIVAPEALLFKADRRGARLEPPGAPAARAAGEWGETLDDPEDSLALVELYRQQGIRYFADLTPNPEETGRLAQHAAIRENYQILVDRSEVLIAELIRKSKIGNASPVQTLQRRPTQWPRPNRRSLPPPQPLR